MSKSAANKGLDYRHPGVGYLPADRRTPLIVHVIHRLAVGGLENGLINLINHMPAERYSHAIVCLTDYTDFHQRLRRDDVPVYALHRRSGHDFGLLWRLWRLLRQLRPDVVHSRNLGTLECQLPAALAGVRHRVHGEHGRDMSDLDGKTRKYLLLRKLFRPLVHRYVALSQDFEHWLQAAVGVRAAKIVQIYNGVDAERFQPASGAQRDVLPAGFAPPGSLVFGTVGRMQAEKNQVDLMAAFVHALQQRPELRERLRLVLVGEGPLQEPVRALAERAGVQDCVWLAGQRDNIPSLLQALDVFVLPSLAEGISNTILEAMATGLPVIATRVGGNAELVADGETGYVVPPAQPQALAAAMTAYADAPEDCARHGAAGRARVEREFAMGCMVQAYTDLYDELTAAAVGVEGA